MDKLFLIFVLFVFLTATVAYFLPQDQSKPIKLSDRQSTTKSIITTSSSSSSTTSTSIMDNSVITTTSSSTTSTTIPLLVRVGYLDVGRCLSTQIGNLNTVIAEVNENQIRGTWGFNPEPKFYFSCDSEEKILFEKISAQGAQAIKANQDLIGKYRLSHKCGRNMVVKDLYSCSDLEIFLDTSNLNISSIGQDKTIQESTTTTTTPSITTTTIYRNPYLDRFRGLGYRKADFDVAWMCPSCLPMVNKIVINEPGVKSRSISFKQDITYVIYDPDVVSLERIHMLLNAGGSPELVDDYEL